MAIKMDSYGNVYDDELMHYGRKGMKWGKNIFMEDPRSIANRGNSGGFRPSNYAANSGIRATQNRVGNNYFNKDAADRAVNAINRKNARPTFSSVRRRVARGNIAANSGIRATQNRVGNNYFDKDAADRAVNAINRRRTSGNLAANSGIRATQNRVGNNYFDKDAADRAVNAANKKARARAAVNSNYIAKKAGKAMNKSISAIQKDQSGLLYKAKKTVNRIFKKISKFFGW